MERRRRWENTSAGASTDLIDVDEIVDHERVMTAEIKSGDGVREHVAADAGDGIRARQLPTLAAILEAADESRGPVRLFDVIPDLFPASMQLREQWGTPPEPSQDGSVSTPVRRDNQVEVVSTGQLSGNGDLPPSLSDEGVDGVAIHRLSVTMNADSGF
jgi:hypothetical protein